jgi:hypothetical protein
LSSSLDRVALHKREEILVVRTYVHYIYRVPGASEAVEIATERWPDKTPQDILPLIGSVGSPTSVTPDDPDGYGEKRDFKVLGLMLSPSPYWQRSAPATVSNMLVVSVTDLDEPV